MACRYPMVTQTLSRCCLDRFLSTFLGIAIVTPRAVDAPTLHLGTVLKSPHDHLSTTHANLIDMTLKNRMIVALNRAIGHLVIVPRMTHVSSRSLHHPLPLSDLDSA